MLHRWCCATLILSITLAITPKVSAAPLPFPDMESSWFRYREAVETLKEEGVFQGYPDGTFHPYDPINRAEFLTIVFRGRSDVTPVQRTCFPDVPKDVWYAPFVCAAKQRGIISGYPDGTFRPEQSINMAEAIRIAWNAYGQKVEPDRGEEWYQPYVTKIGENDILPADSFIPWHILTRERAGDLLHRILLFTQEKRTLRRSPGCGLPIPSPPQNILVEGRERSFLLTVPKEYRSDQPAPLLIAFHGRTNSNEQVRAYYEFDAAGKEFLIAYPAALQNQNGSFSWADPGDRPRELRDLAFFDALVELLTEKYCVDMDRIFVAGHSLGGWFANSVACVRGSGVRASATVGGDSVIDTCTGPAAAMIIHNPLDRLAAFSGAEKTRALRVEQNACSWETQPAVPEDLRCVRHLACSDGNDVLFCPHTQNEAFNGSYYPHNWPKGTGEAIIQFFRSL